MRTTQTVRTLGLQDRPQHSKLITQSFGAFSPGGSYLDDFAVWDLGCSIPDRICVGEITDLRLVGTGSARVARWHWGSPTNARVLRLGIIGAVAVAPDYRRQGVASRLVAYLNDWLEARADVGVLWASDRWYERFGYHPGGQQARVPLRPWAAHPWLPAQRGYRPEIFALRQTHSTGLCLDAADERWWSRHANVEWYWRQDRRGQFAYAGVGRGIDLGGYVHEWGGNPELLREILVQLAHRDASLLTTPAHAACLGLTPSVIEPQGQFRLFHQEALSIGNKRPISSLNFSAIPGEDIAPLFKFAELRTEVIDKAGQGGERSGMSLGYSSARFAPSWLWGLDGA